MKSPAHPDDEAARLRALASYELLDTPPEPAFDGLTRLAARIAEVPIALMSLVDADRQWFKSRYGLDAPETARELSFCGHVVADDAPLVVADTHCDERFADNPLVTGEPGVRFYAGFPLRSAEGHVLGTLCAIDRRPRDLDPGQLEALELLAAQATAQLELRRSNLRLRGSARRFRAVVDASLDAIVLWDADRRVIHANPATAGVLGFSPRELVGRGVREALPFLGGAPREVGSAGMREVEAVRKDGARFPAEVAEGEYEVDGARCFVGMVRDLSERKQSERAQGELLSTISHELRTPLTSIRGVLGLLAGGALGGIGDDAREFVGIALTNCDRVVRLVNDILDIERVESRGVAFEFVAIELRRAVAAALAANSAYAAASEVRLAVVSDIPAGEVVVDADRLGQVFTNLLSNAVKFSPAGAAVELSAAARDDVVRIEVRDHGAGVPPGFAERLFRRFSQAARVTGAPRGGSGLGLAISKALVEQMRGQIGYAPAEGGGSIFFFELPLLHAVAAAPTAGAPLALVCADEPAAWGSLAALAGSAGFVAHVAPTSERTRRLCAANRYDAVVLDLALGDGGAAARLWELRAAEVTRVQPIVVVSTREAEEPSAILVRDLVVKPFDRRRVIAAIDAAARASGGAHRRLLCAVDDPEAERAVQEALPASWTAIAAGSAAEAVAALGVAAFDVALLDLSLPGGGVEEVISALGAAQAIVFARDSPAELCRRLRAALLRSRAGAAGVRERLAAIAARAEA